MEDNNGQVIFGLGRMKILQAVARCGSLNAAAKELGMSYRGLWGKIRASEEALGQALLKKSAGGAAGGGSQLTPFAEDIMDRYMQLKKFVDDKTDRIFEKNFPESDACMERR